MLPAVVAALEKKVRHAGPSATATRSDFKDPDKGWETLDPQPRYMTNYIGLRNRLGVLIENYVHADFKTRVAGNYACCRPSSTIARPTPPSSRGSSPTPTPGRSPAASRPAEKDTFGLDFDVQPLPGNRSRSSATRWRLRPRPPRAEAAPSRG